MAYPHMTQAVAQRAVELRAEEHGNKVKYIIVSSMIQGDHYLKESIIARNNGTKSVETTLVPIAKKK